MPWRLLATFLLLAACAAPTPAGGGDGGSGGGDMKNVVDQGVPLDMIGVRDMAQARDLSCVYSAYQGTAPCELVCQNCADPTKKCGLGSGADASIQCLDNGTVYPNQACGGTSSSCVAGGVCLGVASVPEDVAVCYEWCHADSDCKTGGKCVYGVQGVTNAKTCSDPVMGCNPVLKTGCAGVGMSCYVVLEGQTGCHIPGGSGEGDVCDSDFSCQAGLSCLSTDGVTLSCFKLCRLAGTDCTTGSCVEVTFDWGTDAGVWPTYGACVE